MKYNLTIRADTKQMLTDGMCRALLDMLKDDWSNWDVTTEKQSFWKRMYRRMKSD